MRNALWESHPPTTSPLQSFHTTSMPSARTPQLIQSTFSGVLEAEGIYLQTYSWVTTFSKGIQLG